VGIWCVHLVGIWALERLAQIPLMPRWAKESLRGVLARCATVEQANKRFVQPCLKATASQLMAHGHGEIYAARPMRLLTAARKAGITAGRQAKMRDNGGRSRMGLGLGRHEEE